MDDKSRKSIDRRLARLEGQVGGLRRMVSEDRYCIDILTQLAAARSALDQIGASVAANHVHSCICGNFPGPHKDAAAKSEDELVEELRVTLSRLMR